MWVLGVIEREPVDALVGFEVAPLFGQFGSEFKVEFEFMV